MKIVTKVWGAVKQQTAKVLARSKKIVKSPRLKDKRLWLAAAVVLVLAVFWLLPAFAGAAPGELGYSIKRGEETVASNLAPLSSWRESLRLDFANNRVSEASYVANRANQAGGKNQKKTAATIIKLLDTYESTYEVRTANLKEDLNAGKKLSKADAKKAQVNVVTTYAILQLLRLQAPNAAQLAVLTAIDDTQQNIAALSDVLGTMPLSHSDLAQLAKLVPLGIVKKSDVDTLASVHSNRELHAKVQDLIEAGRLPSDTSYLLDLDLIKQTAPTKVAAFETEAQFEQLQRISAVLTASRPTAPQQQAIKALLAKYTPGQTIPNDDIYQYVAPVVDAMALSGQLQANLPTLNAIHMDSDDQTLFDNWKRVLDPPNLTETYQKLMTSAGSQPALHLRSLTRTQTELTDAQKAQVAYLVMPPGWDNSKLGLLDNQMSTEIAETSFQQAKPDTNQELARLSSVQQQLQASLNSLNTTYNDNTTKLQTQINSFSGTPDQLAQLKTDLANLVQSQTTTVTNLQTQLTNSTDAHTKLGDSIENLRQEQLTNLTNLELRAATHANQLTDSAKAQLTTSLNQIESRSQTLITNLQTKVNSLDAAHSQLRTQLTSEISTITADYQQLASNVQAQLDAGVATSTQLQSTLGQVQTTIASEQTKVHDLTASAATLSQLVGQIQTTAAGQIRDLQHQVDVVKLDQQTTDAAVGDLQTITQTSQSLIAGLQTQVNALGTGQTALRQELTGALQTVRDDYTQLAAYTQAQLDAGVATSTQLQANLQTVQTSLAQHTTQLTNLASGNAALTQLVDQVKADATAQTSSLQTQVAGLVIGQQAVQTSLNDLQTQQSTDVVELSSQLAGLGVLQTEAQATITALTQQQVAAQSSINHLTANYTALQAAFDTSLEDQAAVQTTIANQQSELTSLAAQTQSALDTLTQQQTQLSGQIASLAATTTNLSQTLTSVQTTAAATQTQLATLLASPPWALATGAYVTQTQLDNLSSQLNTQFAQKSAQLDAQFQAYQTQLNASVSQLNSQVQSITATTTTTAATQTQQQTQITSLSSQIQTLQTQVQQLIAASVPHGTGL